MKNLLEFLNDILLEIDAEISSGEHYAFLPEIEESIKSMITDLDKSKDVRTKHAAALGRLVLEDFLFSESALGERLLAISDEYAK